MKKITAVLLALIIVISIPFCAFASGGKRVIKISPDSEKTDISDILYGAFIEDISYACDGGLVSNLVSNNSFEYDGMNGVLWLCDKENCFTVTDEFPMNEKNTHCAKMSVDGDAVLKNVGYLEIYKYKTWEIDDEKLNMPDMGFKKGEKYEFSCYIKNIDFDGKVFVSLMSENNNEEAELDINCKDWTKRTVELESKATEDGGLKLRFEGKGAILLDFFKLIPESSHGYGSEEWKYVTLRSDLYQALEDWAPKFLRFPGGCLCEGTDLNNLYSWKNTLGPIEQRKQELNLWRDDYWHRHYINTNSMGYHEFLQLCKDIGAEPVPILNVALTCQGRNGYNWNRDRLRNGEMTEEEWEAYLDTIALRPGTPEFEQYVQDIYDLIDYCNGDGTTEWSRKRVENGQKEPFNLKYIGLGNENWGDVYFRNFEALYKAVKEKYPEITIISSAGAWLDGEDFDEAWKLMNEKYPDTTVDEHYYTEQGYLFSQNERYDSYDRNGAGVFIGEYAATSQGFGTIQTKANLWAAIEEAGYLTGFERNGDVVKMASYAPTFAKINAMSWNFNMIWFNSQEAVLSPDYYLQLFFANNTGNKYIKTELENGKTFVERDMYESVTVNEDEQVIYVKIVNASGKNQTVDLDLTGYDINRVSVQRLSELFRGACNEPGKCYVTPSQKDIKANGSTVKFKAGMYSINVIRIAYGDNDGSALFTLPDTLPKDKGLYVPIAITAAVCGSLVLVIIAAVSITLIVKHHKKKKVKKVNEQI